MKPITGTVVSSKPLSLSQSALVLSKFLEMNTGADKEMLAYLRRSSQAFDEFVDFHREIKGGRIGGDATKRKKIEKWDGLGEEEEVSNGGVVQGSDRGEGGRKKEKNMKERKWRSTEEENDMNDGPGVVVEEKLEMKSKSMRKKSKDGEEGEKENLSENKEKKPKEYRGDNGFGKIEADKKEKRKHVDDEGVVEGNGGRENGSKKHQRKKKKRKVKDEI